VEVLAKASCEREAVNSYHLLKQRGCVEREGPADGALFILRASSSAFGCNSVYILTLLELLQSAQGGQGNLIGKRHLEKYSYPILT